MECCSKCGSSIFLEAINMESTRYCPCGHTWLPLPTYEQLDSLRAQLAAVVEALQGLVASCREHYHPDTKQEFNAAVQTLADLPAGSLAHDERVRAEGWKACSDKIAGIASEFGDDPKACLGIIGELLFASSASAAAAGSHDERVRSEAFDAVLAVKRGPCYSSGLPCGCVEDSVKSARKAKADSSGAGEK